jgi:heme/copper-type cytochrome/quinol oxidase subunit 2
MSHCNCKTTCSCERQNEIHKRNFPETREFSHNEILWILIPALVIISLFILNFYIMYQWITILNVGMFVTYVVAILAYINSAK